MKLTSLLFCFLIATFCCHAQTMETINKSLVQSFARIHTNDYDSLEAANDNFEQLLLKYTAEDPKTIEYSFEDLVDSGLNIQTSNDGLFRIYNWDDMSGGTMRFFRNVFQYKSGNIVYSKTLRVIDSTDDELNIGCNYFSINEVSANGVTYYVTASGAKAATLLYLYTIKVFSIEGANLNDTVKLIMTKTGFHNALSYEVDWTLLVNRNNNAPTETDRPIYDTESNILSFPLIQEDGKITAKRIRYRFNGRYFVKM